MLTQLNLHSSHTCRKLMTSGPASRTTPLVPETEPLVWERHAVLGANSFASECADTGWSCLSFTCECTSLMPSAADGASAWAAKLGGVWSKHVPSAARNPRMSILQAGQEKSSFTPNERHIWHLNNKSTTLLSRKECSESGACGEGCGELHEETWGTLKGHAMRQTTNLFDFYSGSYF